MKKLINIIFLFIIFYLCNNQSLYSQTSWQWINPIPSGNFSNEIVFIDLNTGIAVGAFGDIKRTTNKGNSWHIVNSKTSNNLNSVSYINSYCIAVGDSGTILKSTDNGVNWIKYTASISNNLLSVFIINFNDIFVTGSNGIILSSTNSGIGWTIINSPTTEHLTSIKFPLANLGFICGTNGLILKTTNSGQNWSILFSGTNIVDFNDIFFTSPTNGYAVGDATGNIYRTTNGGDSWTVNPIGSFTYQTEVKFINVNTGFILGTSPNILLKTTNTGNTWFTNPSTNGYSYTTLGINGYDLHISDIQGNLFHFINVLNQWMNRTTGFRDNINGLDFINENTGFVVCDSGKVYKTTNTALSWSQQFTPISTSLNKVEMLNQNDGYIIGDNVILKTSNGGIMWSAINNTISSIKNLKFINVQTGIVVGNGLWKTENGGNAWSQKLSGNFTDIEYISADTVISLAGGIVYKSIDGGNNWNLIKSGLNAHFISFKNSLTGVVISQIPPTFIHKTTNSGLNWTSIPSMFTEFVNDIKYINNDTLIAVGSSVIYSTNDGLNWFKQKKITSNVLNAIENTFNGYTLVSGEFGTLLKTNSAGIVSIPLNSIMIPTKFILHQNYPNPFNPVTNIQYDLPQSSFLSLKVYDLNGRLISELENAYKSAGAYSITFDGSKLSSGVYFCKLTAGEFSDVKRMVLLK